LRASSRKEEDLVPAFLEEARKVKAEADAAAGA